MFNRETHELEVYSPRALLLKHTLPFFIINLFLLFLLFLFIFLFTKFLILRVSMNPFEGLPLLLFTFIFFIVSLTALSLMLTITISIVHKFISSKPALLVSLQGVYLRDLPVTDNTFFPWDKIASFYLVPVPRSYSRPINNFCLELKDHGKFMSRFHPLPRLLIRFYSGTTGTLIGTSFRSTNTLIFVSQRFLAEPVERILMSIEENFQQEIQADDIRIVDRRIEKSSV
jgi:hypothetical protein